VAVAKLKVKKIWCLCVLVAKKSAGKNGERIFH
jgi:hypothetical protein